MSNHIFFDQTNQFGAGLRAMLNINETADSLLQKVRDEMVQMLEGDGTQDAHYSTIALRYGVRDIAGNISNVAAHNAFIQIDTAYAKSSGNGSVSNVRAARDQLFSQLRG